MKLTKKRIKEKDKVSTKLAAAKEDLQTAVDDYNEAMAAAWETLQEEVTKYNEVLAQAREYVADKASEMEGEMGDKSDKWQEGDRGQAAQAMMDEWNNVSLDDIELEKPEDLDLDDIDDHQELVDQLPNEPA